jgi:NADH-quinone oxidoreductase subunit M
MANSGLPGTSGFVGEWLVILASMKVSFWYAALAGSTLVFGAAYTLWMYKRVVFGAVANHHIEELADVNKREIFVLGVLALLVLGMGLYPAPLGEVLHESVNEILRLAAPGRKLLMGM